MDLLFALMDCLQNLNVTRKKTHIFFSFDVYIPKYQKSKYAFVTIYLLTADKRYNLRYIVLYSFIHTESNMKTVRGNYLVSLSLSRQYLKGCDTYVCITVPFVIHVWE